MRATKIVATLGPSTDTEEILRKLFEAGVDVFRLNASHGTQDDHARRIKAVRELSAELKRHVGILLDLQGPKIRLGTFKNGPYRLEDGATFTITTESVEGTAEIASTTYTELARDVKPGDAVGDGYHVESITSDAVTLKKVVQVGQGTQTYTQVIPLSDTGGAPSQFSGAAPGNMGSPGLPGMGFPGGRRAPARRSGRQRDRRRNHRARHQALG